MVLDIFGGLDWDLLEKRDIVLRNQQSAMAVMLLIQDLHDNLMAGL